MLNPGPGKVSGDTAQLADVPAEDRRTKASSFHSNRHEFKEAKKLSQDQQMLPDRRKLLPLSGARDVFRVLSRPGSRVVTGMGTSSLRQRRSRSQRLTLPFGSPGNGSPEPSVQ